MLRTVGERERRHPTVAGDAASQEQARLDGIDVLLVDDEADSNEVVAELLQTHGAAVRVAGSVAHARDVLAGWHPHLVVTDIGMPDEDGYAMWSTLREASDDRAGDPGDCAHGVHEPRGPDPSPERGLPCPSGEAAGPDRARERHRAACEARVDV